MDLNLVSITNQARGCFENCEDFDELEDDYDIDEVMER